MRRLAPLAVGVLLVLGGCGTERAEAPARAERTSSPAPSTSTAPSTDPGPAPTPAAGHGAEPSGPLADFPLATGLPGTNDDDGSPVVVTGEPATKAFGLCGRAAWAPREGTSDVIGVRWSAEAEWNRGRTLVLYPTAAAATAAVDAARDAVAACPDEPTGPDTGTTHTVVDQALGEQSAAWADTYYVVEHGEKLHDTGLTVYHVVRVGRAVLLTYEYAEANGSDRSREQAIDRTERQEQPLVSAMADLPKSEEVVLTPRGAGPFELGMSVEEARAAGATVESHGGASSCADLTWTSPSGATVHGSFSPGAGLGYVSLDGGRTADGVALGATVAELRAAYPDLQRSDNGLWYVDREPGDLAFATYEGGVNWMVAMGADQRCAG
jgi:hypothetical protein